MYYNNIRFLSADTEARKPSDSNFKQQRLPAWQPILTAGTVLPMFFVIGILFIPIGIGLLVTSNNVVEHIEDYTDCNSESGNRTCADIIGPDMVSSNGSTCICRIRFKLAIEMPAPVYIYYGLTNFYQNHRRYVKSRDDNQLLGKDVTKVSKDCAPFDTTEPDGQGTPYAPCGAIANSMFSDSFDLFFENEENHTNVKVDNTGIAWPTDKNAKFDNPEPKNDLPTAFMGTVKPLYWSQPVYELDAKNPANNGYKNEDLIVWMRTAALPNFRKLHRRVKHTDSPFQKGLPSGDYTVRIQYSYPVKSFQGTKTFI
ncbi:PREDICTED: cell cycle control protein 50A-like, partial [Priapulus caudatus]|uniref:Cell cycle control protein 50A-like n=1 Tax=Priapulus caudatus TaxID=37621 RepID=A0ABM1F2X9_PRICU